MAIGTHISIITLNVNGLNAPTKRYRLAKWIQKQDPYICCLQETHFRPQEKYRLKVRGWKNIFHANGKQKKAGVAILISDKIDLKLKKITRDKEGHYRMIQGSIQEEDITIVIFFTLRSILSDMRIATPAFFCFLYAWDIFFHPLTFHLCVLRSEEGFL